MNENIVTMVKISKISLNKHKNSWIIGTPQAVDINSSGFSTSLQIKYNKKPSKETKLAQEIYHKHLENIDECYLILKGWLKLIVENKEHYLTEKEIIRVPADHCHMVLDYSDDIEYLTIRAPPSNEKMKIECKFL